MNRTIIHWLEGDSIPSHYLLLEALPGVGNVGKIIIDALIDRHDSTLLAWVLHPDYPPHATLDEEGLLRPPRMSIYSVNLPDGRRLVTVGGDVQPLTPAGQHEVANALLTEIAKSASPMMLVLAGLAAEPSDHEVHLVCADSSTRDRLVDLGLDPSSTQPQAGVIGTNALLASLAPLHGVPVACAVAETVGSTVDAGAAGRLVNWLEGSFGIGLDVPVDTTQELADRIRRDLELDPAALEALLGDPEPTPEFYV